MLLWTLSFSAHWVGWAGVGWGVGYLPSSMLCFQSLRCRFMLLRTACSRCGRNMHGSLCFMLFHVSARQNYKYDVALCRHLLRRHGVAQRWVAFVVIANNMILHWQFAGRSNPLSWMYALRLCISVAPQCHICHTHKPEYVWK